MKAAKPSSQLQIAPIEHPGTVYIKLKQSSRWVWGSGSKRGRLEIMAEILFHCCQQKTKTSIMYKTNLNYMQLKTYLRYLTSRGLLSRDMQKYVPNER